MTDEQLSRLNNVYNNREKAIAENNAGYDKLINDAAVLRDQTNATAEQMQIEQDKIADANLAFQNTLINQGKEQAQKQNKKEQNKALNEYQAYTNPYGYQSEIMGQNNLTNSGVNATKELGAYTAYQNRVATANSSLQSAMTQYDNALLEAQKDNDVAKAQNALTKLQTQLQNAETYFNNTSALTQNKLNQINSLNQQFDNQYNAVYNQILSEQQQQEAIRQFNETLAFQKKQASKSYSGGGGGRSPKVYYSSDGGMNSTVTPQNTSDYYFRSTTGSDYQPRYVYDTRLEKSGVKLSDVATIKGISGSKNIWKGVNEKGKTAYYIWDEDHYVDVTNYMK